MQSCKLFGTSRLAGGFLFIQKDLPESSGQVFFKKKLPIQNGNIYLKSFHKQKVIFLGY